MMLRKIGHKDTEEDEDREDEVEDIWGGEVGAITAGWLV